MVTRPWEENWWVNEDQIRRGTPQSNGGVDGCVISDTDVRGDVQRLIDAAPAMARALCLVEWSGNERYGYGPACPVCMELPPPPAGDGKHAHTCALDAALTAAGLDAEARGKVRQSHSEGR